MHQVLSSGSAIRARALLLLLLLVSSVGFSEDAPVPLRLKWVPHANDIAGSAAQSPIHFLGSDRSFQPVNMLEEDQRTGDQKVLCMKPHEISTLKVRVP